MAELGRTLFYPFGNRNPRQAGAPGDAALRTTFHQQNVYLRVVRVLRGFRYGGRHEPRLAPTNLTLVADVAAEVPIAANLRTAIFYACVN